MNKDLRRLIAQASVACDVDILLLAESGVYRFFYNPMWGSWGDRTVGTPGSYFHRAPTVAGLFCHVFEQVLLRPVLMDLRHGLAILDCIGGERLLTASTGVPRSTEVSDHLRLAFRLNLD